jgi:hypothetical protein
METIHLNGVSSIKGEINSILTLMRLNTRWANNKVRINNHRLADNNIPRITEQDQDLFDENPLVSPFRKLNRYLEGVYDLMNVDIVAYISPFHKIIVSEQASGPLTCAALGSIIKFVSYGLLSANFPRAREGIALVANSIAGCIFEETDWESDEVILMKLLELSTLVYRCDAAKLLSVGSAWEVYSTCISIYSQYRASKILKSEAESALRNLTLTAFSRAHISSQMSLLELEDSSTLEDNNYQGFTQLMKDRTWESASANYDFDGPVGIPLLLGKIMTVLSGLMDFHVQPIQAVRFSLALVNIALEAGGSSLGSIPVLVDMLRGDICRHLLKASQSDNLEVFSLALRVVFNLFMSIKDHIKIQLEVFLSSVHLRLLSFNQASAISLAREELVLESLLEFCREPSLMQDIYTNYDCDVQCTNLFDSIVTTLCQRTLPDGFTLTSPINSHLSESDALSFDVDIDFDSMTKRSTCLTNILNRLALDGILSILHAISYRCKAYRIETRRTSLRRDNSWTSSAESTNDGPDTPRSAPSSPNASASQTGRFTSLTPTKLIEDVTTRFGGAVSPTNEEFDPQIVRAMPSPCTPTNHTESPPKASHNLNCLFNQAGEASGISSDNELESVDEGRSVIVEDDDTDFVLQARARTADILRQRKLKKQRLKIAADKFNANPMKIEWLRYALDAGLISTTTSLASPANIKNSSNADIFNISDPKIVARFLRNTPGLGKTQIGEFISKGPADLYPFHAAVLKEYVETFDFHGKYSTFDKALRLFLGHFRLPGEAQCIDRIMESFAGKLFRDLGSDGPFRSADSAFILAFSTIMLNTDLHNPQIPVNKKMTKDQFVKNNRGINDGNDLPREYLENLYDEIKTTQIQVDADIVDLGNASIIQHDFTDPKTWNSLIKNRSNNAPPIFTPTVTAREVAISTIAMHHPNPLNIALGHDQQLSNRFLALPISHEKDMFLVMANQVFEAMLLMWTYVEDDAVTNKLLDGTCNFIRISIDLNLLVIFDGIIKILATRAIHIIEYEKLGNKSWSDSKQAKGKASDKKSTSSWDDYYDTASMIATEERNRNVLSKYSYSIYKESLEQLLTTRFDVLANPSSSHHSPSIQPNSPSATSPAKGLPWIGSSKIRGELVLKMLFHFVNEHASLISTDGWSGLVAILLYARSLAALPPSLATIRDSYSCQEKTSISFRLPLSKYGKSFVRGEIRDLTEERISHPTAAAGLSEKFASRAADRAATSQTAKARATGLWGALGSLIWSNNDPSNIPATSTESSSNESSDAILTLSQLQQCIQSEQALPDNPNPEYQIIDGNCRSGHSHPHGADAIDGNDDMLRIVLFTSHIDEIIFISSSKSETMIMNIFETFLKYLVDVISVIIQSEILEIDQESMTASTKPDQESSQSFTLVHAQRDAVILVEWISTILMSNPAQATNLWSKFHRTILVMVFESEFIKLSSRSPYLLERLVVTFFHVASAIMPSASNQQNRIALGNTSSDQFLWTSMRLFKNIRPALMSELGDRVAAGILELLRSLDQSSKSTTSSGIMSKIDSLEKWAILLSLLSSSMKHAVSRVFTWETLLMLLDKQCVSILNYQLLRNLNFQFLAG